MSEVKVADNSRHAVRSPVFMGRYVGVGGGSNCEKNTISGLRTVNPVSSVTPDLSLQDQLIVQDRHTRESMLILRHVILISGTASNVQ